MILEFIALIRESNTKIQTEIFTQGACYQFYLILKHRFPNAEPYYDLDHVITKIDAKYYDITGEVSLGNHTLMTEEPKNWGRRYEDR